MPSEPHQIDWRMVSIAKQIKTLNAANQGRRWAWLIALGGAFPVWLIATLWTHDFIGSLGLFPLLFLTIFFGFRLAARIVYMLIPHKNRGTFLVGENLSNRALNNLEKEMLTLIANGLPFSEVAVRLSTSESSIKRSFEMILSKFSVKPL